MGIEWSLIAGSFVEANSSNAPEPTLRFHEQGPYSVVARIYPKECILNPSPTSLGSIGDLKRVYALVPTYWEKSWRIDVPSGTSQDIVLEELEFQYQPSKVVAFVERVGLSTGPSADDGRLVLRTPVNNDFAVPSDDVPPGFYRAVWRAQGAAGGAVVGDDWMVTLQVQYFG